MHQLQATIDSVSAAFKAAGDANPVFLSTEEKRSAIVELKLIESQATELRLRIEATGQDVADHDGARDVGAVLVAGGLDDPRHAHGEVKLAEALERHEQVRAGLAQARFTVTHAQAIVQSLDALPDDIDGETVAKAEVQLCAWAEEFTPRDVRRLGQHVVTVVAPDVGEAAEARALERLEDEARSKATLSIKPRGDGTTQIYGLLPDAVGARLVAVLESFAQPRKTALEADGKTRPRNRLMAEALEPLLERLDPATLPTHGGDATTVIVTVPLASLRNDLGLAAMADGTVITAAETRRLACTASIIPAVLGGKSEILDLGRAKRLFSPHNAKHSVFATRNAVPKAARFPPRGATRTIPSHGHEAGRPISIPECCYAGITTAGSTTRNTKPPAWRTATSDSTCDAESRPGVNRSGPRGPARAGCRRGRRAEPARAGHADRPSGEAGRPGDCR